MPPESQDSLGSEFWQEIMLPNHDDVNLKSIYDRGDSSMTVKQTFKDPNNPTGIGSPLPPSISLSSLLDKYNSTERHKKMHALIVGDKGVGKTTLIKTSPKPALVFTFDPGGLSVLKKEIASGEVIPVDLENDDPRNPTAFLEYQTQYNAIGKAGIFQEVASVFLDSITTMNDAIIHQILQKEHRMLASMSTKSDQAKNGMQRTDWGTLLTTWLWISRDLAMLPCHTILLGHLSRNQDDITGGMVRGLLLPGQAKDKVPVLLHEYYVLLAGKNDGKRTLLTQHRDTYQATTRMGAGIFKAEEPPDIRALLIKAGLPAEDKK